jgi:hypothetical protein
MRRRYAVHRQTLSYFVDNQNLITSFFAGAIQHLTLIFEQRHYNMNTNAVMLFRCSDEYSSSVTPPHPRQYCAREHHRDVFATIFGNVIMNVHPPDVAYQLRHTLFMITAHIHRHTAARC